MIKKTIAFATLALGLAATGSAQDISGDPISDTVYLEAGFTPDPYVIDVTSGGTIDASSSVQGCSGYISSQPDVRLTFSGNNDSNSSPLYIHASSNEDTTLLINAPDGQWYCNDDGGEGTNPMIVFGPAMSGDYEIWIGSYDRGEYHQSQLLISELSGR